MKSLTPLCLALLAAATHAQTWYLPKGWETTADNNYDLSYFGASATNLPVHVQQLYAPADMPRPVIPLTKISCRRNNFYGNTIYTSSTKLSLTISHGPNAPSAASTTFASNVGTDAAKVFDGTVNWPGASKGSGPAPFTFPIPFTQNFNLIQVKGKSIVFDFLLTTRDHKTSRGSQTSMLLDAAALARGTRVSNGSAPSGCRDSNGKYNNSLSYSTSGLINAGGPFQLTYRNLFPSAPVVLTLSGFGVPPNNGPWPLPINLTGLGASGCTWHVGLELGAWIVLNSDASGAATLKLVIPPGLGGVTFYDHGIVRDANANSWGWVTTWSSGWKIGSGKAPDATMVYRTQDTTGSPTGFRRTQYGMIWQNN